MPPSTATAPSADLNRTKMAATQAVMRHTSLTESAKRQHIRTLQQLARDAGLDDASKIRRIEEVAAAVAAGGAGGAGGVETGKGGAADDGEDTGSSTTDERSSSSSLASSGGNDDSDDTSVSSADVNRTKMQATQDIMRNTSLNQAEKPNLIRKVQAVAADDALSPEAKMTRMRSLANGRDEDAGAQVGGGNGDDDKEADVPASDVAKAKMKATQDIMRNTTLNQAEKPALIRRVQAVSADRDLGNGAKVRQMQRLAEGNDGAATATAIGSSSSSSSSPAPTTRDVSDADVNRAKMEATQTIMRDTALDQAAKPRMIREVQATCADASLDNGAKVDRIRVIVSSKAGPPSPSAAAAAAAPSTDDADAKKSPADLREEKEAEANDDDDGDDEPVDDVDLTTFKSEVIQGLIKNKGIAGEEKQAKIRAAHAVVLNPTYEDGEKIRRLRKIQRGKAVVEPIGESVFAPLPVPGAPALAPPEEVAAPTAGNGTADERLRAKMSGGAGGAGGGGGQAGVTTNSTANDRLRAKMQGGAAAGGAAGGAAPGVSAGSTANDRLRGKLFFIS